MLCFESSQIKRWGSETFKTLASPLPGWNHKSTICVQPAKGREWGAAKSNLAPPPKKHAPRLNPHQSTAGLAGEQTAIRSRDNPYLLLHLYACGMRRNEMCYTERICPTQLASCLLASVRNWKSIDRKDQCACAGGCPFTQQMHPCLSNNVRDTVMPHLSDLLSCTSTSCTLYIVYMSNKPTRRLFIVSRPTYTKRHNYGTPSTKSLLLCMHNMYESKAARTTWSKTEIK